MLEKLKKRLKQLGKVAIAYSGGIDSSFLLYVASKVLKSENVLAIFVDGQMVSRREYNDAISFAEENNINYKIISFDALQVQEFKENHKDRCYYCKKRLMSEIKKVAKDNGFLNVLDGKNIDDTRVYRPGNKATKELGIISLLEELQFSKEDIRKYSRECGIKFWNKPSNSCLATRFPYNTILTNDDLKKVELAEEIIKKLDIPKVRVRVHGSLARIEIDKIYFEKLISNDEYIKEIKDLGFENVALDLIGLRSGSFD